MNSYVRRQAQEIADTTSGHTCRVIVQMKPPPEVERFISETSRTVIEQRNAISARSLIPPKAELLNRKRLTLQSLGGRTVVSAHALLAGKRLDGRHDKVGVLRSGEDSLSPLLASGIYARAAAGKRPAVTFPLAAAAAITIDKSDLESLATDVPDVAGLFASRFVRVPPVMASSREPAVVTDNRGHAWGVSRTGALAVWGAYGARGEGVRVAVLDTGYDPSHPDLRGKLAGFAEFDEFGLMVNGSNSIQFAYDDGTHGSHVSGTIVGGNASGRWIGMAPGAKVLAGLVLKNGVGTSEQILAGIQWAVSEGADVINLSLGGLDMSPDVVDTYTLAILNASRMGIPVVVAVGNEGAGTSGSPGNDLFALTVGATDVEDRAAGFSGGRTQIIRKSRYVDEKYLPLPFSKPELTAPGVDIYSSTSDGSWQAFSGTSMAVPHVSGAIALLLSNHGGVDTVLGGLTGRQRVDVIQQLLTSTVKEIGEAGQDHRYGFGRLDVLRAYGYGVSLGYLSTPP